MHFFFVFCITMSRGHIHNKLVKKNKVAKNEKNGFQVKTYFIVKTKIWQPWL